MDYRTLVSVGRVVLALGISGSAGAVSAADPLASMLSCERPPEPTQILMGFKQSGLLGAAVRNPGSNETCWGLEPAFKYHRLQFVSVCATVDSMAEVKHHPTLYAGAVPAPYAGLWLKAQVDEATLYHWAIMTLPSRGHFEVHATADGAVIACTGSWFPPPSAQARA